MSAEMTTEDKMLFFACDKDATLYECHKKLEKMAYSNDPSSDVAKQIFEWVKTGHVNLYQFKHLCSRWNLGAGVGFKS